MSIRAGDINPAYLKQHGLTVPRERKYRNRPTLYKGVLYDSTLEANCAAHLDVLKRAGIVTRWQRQVKFKVGPRITFIADFKVWYATGEPRVMDAKGNQATQTPAFRIKHKLFEAQHGPLDIITHYQDIPLEGRT